MLQGNRKCKEKLIRNSRTEKYNNRKMSRGQESWFQSC